LPKLKRVVGRKIIRRPKVRELTGYSDGHIWRLEKQGLFPPRIQLGPMAIGWYEDEVFGWLRLRVRGMGKHPSPRRGASPKPPRNLRRTDRARGGFPLLPLRVVGGR
jgi:predicted DNA-binding transcriptional regulator AlpA